MEIVIRTDGDQTQVSRTGSESTDMGSGSAQAAGAMVPPPAVAQQAAAVGAINAGPARIPAGLVGEPLANVGALAGQQATVWGGDGGATSAGAAPGSSEEPPATTVEFDEAST